MILVIAKQSRTFQLLMLTCQREGKGCTGSWEGTELRQLTQTGKMDIPYNVTSCSVFKLRGVGWRVSQLRN